MGGKTRKDLRLRNQQSKGRDGISIPVRSGSRGVERLASIVRSIPHAGAWAGGYLYSLLSTDPPLSFSLSATA